MTDETKPKKLITRRRFLKGAAIAGTVAAVPVAITTCQFIESGERGHFQKIDALPAGSGDVVEVKCADWLAKDGKPDAAVIRKMIETGLMQLTGKDTPRAAWQVIVSPGCRVGLKFNQESHNFARVNQPILDAVAAGLMEAGVKRSNIAATETEGAGFTGGFGPDFGGTDAVDFGEGAIRPSKFVRNQIDVLINCCDLKDHGLAGVTAALKNIAFARNTIMNHPWRFHGNNCDPYIPAIFNLDMIRSKVRLNICNGLKAVFNAGPGTRNRSFQWRNDGLLLSVDPVAMDRVAMDLIDKERQRRKMPTIFTGKPGTRGHYLVTAQDVYKLGICDLERIKYNVISLDATS